MNIFKAVIEYAKGALDRHPVVDVADMGEVTQSTLSQAELTLRTVYDYAAIKCIANHAADMPLDVQIKGDMGKWVSAPDDHPAVLLQQEPYKDGTWFEFIEACFFYRELFGHVPIHRVYAGELVSSVYPTRSDRLSVYQTNPDGTVQSWVFEDVDGREKSVIPAENIVISRHFHPSNPVLGLSPSVPSRQALLADFYSQRFNVVFFSNNALPGIVLKTDRILSNIQKRRLLSGWRAAFGGVDKAHGIGIVTAGMEVQVLTPSYRDMAFKDLSASAREKILMARGVPPVLVGISGEAGRAAVKEEKPVSYTGTLKPQVRKVFGTLNRHVFASHGARVVARFEEFLTTAETLTERKQEWRGLWRDGLATRNEARIGCNLDPLPPEAGEVFVTDILPQGKNALAGASGQTVPRTPVNVVAPELPLPNPVVSNSGQTGRADDLLKSYTAAVRYITPSLEAILQDTFDAQLSVAKAATRRDPQLPTLLAESGRKFRSPLGATVTASYEGVFQDACEILHVVAKSEGGLLLSPVCHVEDLLSAGLRDAIYKSEDPEETIRPRLRVLAMDLAFAAANHAAYRAYWLAKVRETTWFSQRDAYSRPTHAQAHGFRAPLRTPFMVDGQKILHPHHAQAESGARLGCRCLTLPVLDA